MGEKSRLTHTLKVALKRKFPNPRREVRYLGNNKYAVSSLSEPGKEHEVDLGPLFEVPMKQPTCPCKGWEIRHWCTHIEDSLIDAFRRMFAIESDSKAKGGTTMAQDPKPNDPTPPPR